MYILDQRFCEIYTRNSKNTLNINTESLNSAALMKICVKASTSLLITLYITHILFIKNKNTFSK